MKQKFLAFISTPMLFNFGIAKPRAHFFALILLTSSYLLISTYAFSQAPQAFPYQAVARNNSGNLLSNQSISIRFSVLDGSNAGPVVYQEKHLTTTNSLGLFNLNIGQGTILSGTFNTINWGSGSKYIKVELDASGGNTFIVMGTTQLLSVPYALYANVPGVAGPQGIQGLTGATGPQGLTGATGPQGIQGLTGATGPQGLTGAQGIQGLSGATGPQGLTGATGAQGIQGIAGINGKTILNGTANPTSGQGVDGDFFLNTISKQIFGPKTAGAWGSGTSIIGPQGTTGTQGLQGIQGIQGIQGPPGTSGSGLPSGTAIGNTTFWNGTSWVVNNNHLFNDGTNIGIGTSTPSSSSALDMTSTSKGFLMPRMTTTQRDAIPTPAIGLQIFNLDDQCTDLYDGVHWIKTCGMKVTGTVSDPNHSTSNSWAQRASLPNTRNNAVAFTIGSKAYVGLGTFLGMSYYNDFYEYDPSTNAWTQKANFPPGARADAVAFSINGKGYVTTGGNGMFVNYDMWEYDPATDAWTQKSNCPGSARWKAQGFAIGNKGYIGLGTDGGNDLNDFWEYNPASDTWTQKANYPGSGRRYTMSLSVNGKGYLGLGTDVNGNYYGDVYEYNATTNAWIAKQNFPGAGFHSMSCFTMNGKGYMGTGYNGANEMTDFWEYNASTDTWTGKANYSGAPRKNAVGFAIGSKGYIATGISSTFMPQNDVWEYMDDNITGNSYSNTVINTTNNSVSDGAWTVYNNHVYNSNSGNVGVGTSSPTNKLSVNGQADFTGNVGIGTTTPINKLSIIGNADINGNFGIGNTNPTSPLTLTGNMDITGEIKNNGVGGLTGQILQSNGNGSMSWINNTGGTTSTTWVSSGNDIKNNNTGNVGIGAFPSAGIKLGVAGNGSFSGNTFSTLAATNGALSLNSVTGSIIFQNKYMNFDGQRIQCSGNNIIFPTPPLTAKPLYLNPLGGGVGIGTTNVNADLQFNNTGINRKIVMFEDANNDHQYYGFGINNAALRYQVGHTGADHVFFAGTGTASSVELMRIKGNGNVGIGTTSSNASLSVARGTGVDGTAMFAGTTYASHFNYSTDEHTYIRGGKNFSRVYINEMNGGKVIIGNITSLPVGYRLYVEQGILTERLRVAVNGSVNWADYVFADDYKLMPLEDVEAFVNEHNHLPNVPSANQMVESGIDVATVDAKLMEKIEELTLYMIEMKKEMKKLSAENASIKSQLKKK